MSCVDVPVQSSSLAHSSAQLPNSEQHGLPLLGGSSPPPKLNPLAGEFEPGKLHHGVRPQAQTGRQGRGRGGRGGLSAAMNRSSQASSQQQQQPSRQPPAATTDAAAAPTTDSSTGGGGGRGGSAGSVSGATRTNAAAGAASSAGVSASRGGAAAPGGGGGGGGAANANHLLNFQYESAWGSSGRGSGRGGGGRSASTRSGGTTPASARRYGGGGSRYDKPQKYDKNKFLQANFRFLVSDAVDVSAFEADADKMFDWEDVLQVEMCSAVPVQCPISLDSPPLCPQITPCGHVFSFPAIMHHLVNHGGEQLRRSAPCPLCFAPVVARELRLVRIRHAVQPPRVGAPLTLALIRRNRNSIIPQPVDAAAAAAAAAVEGGGGGGEGSGGGFAANAPSLFDRNPFAKFVVAGDGRGGALGEEAAGLWRAAAEQLAACAMQLVSEGGSDAAHEAPFVYGALDQLAARARRWEEHRAEGLAAARE
ncbi:hypothetical protein Agub_g2940, partial [Astrephomene gubernaculifera]